MEKNSCLMLGVTIWNEQNDVAQGVQLNKLFLTIASCLRRDHDDGLRLF